MRRPHLTRRSVLGLLFGGLCSVYMPGGSPYIAAQARTREPLTVMSFNIRYGTAADGDNHWTLRRGFLFDVVREQAADVIGLQRPAFRSTNRAAVPCMHRRVGRDDGAEGWEHS
jgi:endonuclease/exonuclease/phosphatase family metal-dependent hydrolase